MCLSQVKSPLLVTRWDNQTLILNPACNVAIPGSDEQSEQTCFTELRFEQMKPWLLSHSSDYPPALIMDSVHNYISCPSSLTLANVNGWLSRVAITDFQICFDSPFCPLHVVCDCFRFSKSCLCVSCGRRPNTKPGNKSSISRLIRLQTALARQIISSRLSQ